MEMTTCTRQIFLSKLLQIVVKLTFLCFIGISIITSAEVITAGGQIFKIIASRFVNVSEEKINLMKENAIPRNTKHATKFGMTHFKGKM